MAAVNRARSADGQRSEALFTQHLADCRRAEDDLLLAQSLGDLVDRVVLFAQRHQQIARLGLLRLSLRPRLWGDEELWIGIATELVAKHTEGARAVAKGAGNLVGRALLKEVGAQGLVHSVARVRGPLEETAAGR